MSKAAIRMVTIEATNRKDAERQLREALGNDLPEEFMRSLLSRIGNELEDEPAKEGFVVPEINSYADMINAVEAVAELPLSQQHEALEAVVLKLAEPFGFSREKALELANAAKERVHNTIEAAGFRVNPEHKRSFGDTPATDTGKGRAEKPTNTEKQADTGRLTDADRDEIRTGFKKAMAALKAAGYTDPAICHIGQFFKAEDALVDTLQAIFHLADSEGDHQHLPSAILFQQISSYLKSSSEMVYSMLRHANVDPETIGFSSYDEFQEKLRKTAHIDERVNRTVENLKRDPAFN